MLVLRLTLSVVVGESDVVMRRQHQAGSVPFQPRRDGRHLGDGRLQTAQQVVQPEHHEGVGVGQDLFVDRPPIAGLVDPLEHRHGVAGQLAGQPLERQRGAVEQFQGAGDPLEEVGGTELRRLVDGPRDVAHLRDRGVAVLHRRRITLGLPGITPCPVDADPALTVPRPGDVPLVVRPGGFAVHVSPDLRGWPGSATRSTRAGRNRHHPEAW